MLLITAILISKLSPRARAFESDATKWCGFPRDVSLGNLPHCGGFLSSRLSLSEGRESLEDPAPQNLKQVDLCSGICRSFSSILPEKGFKL